MQQTKPYVHNAKNAFKRIEFVTKRLGFTRIDDPIKRQYHALNPLMPPRVPRANYANDQVSFVLYERDYTITLHTSYLEARKDFAPQGSIWIIVTKTGIKNGKRHYVASFHRSGDFVKNVTSELEFVVFALRYYRPTKDGRIADIARNYKKGTYRWVIKNALGKTIHASDFYQLYPKIKPAIAGNVFERARQKRYYHQVRKKRLGVRTSIRVMRNPWIHRLRNQDDAYADMP
jgi:hypothetical protein